MRDVEAALQFVDDLLSQDIHNLRFWGVEGVDYNVDDNGEFYRTEESREPERLTLHTKHPIPVPILIFRSIPVQVMTESMRISRMDRRMNFLTD